MGNKGTFIVKVDRCDNETWQGRVIWADENKTEYFRSTLELMQMMDGAIKNGQMSSNIEGTA